MLIPDARASREFCSRPHTAPFSEVTAVDDLICATTSPGSGCIDMLFAPTFRSIRRVLVVVADGCWATASDGPWFWKPTFAGDGGIQRRQRSTGEEEAKSILKKKNIRCEYAPDAQEMRPVLLPGNDSMNEPGACWWGSEWKSGSSSSPPPAAAASEVQTPRARSLVAGQRTHQAWHVHAAANGERGSSPSTAPTAPTAPTRGLGRCRDPERYPKLGSREQHRTQWTRRCILRRSITHIPIPAPRRRALPSRL